LQNVSDFFGEGKRAADEIFQSDAIKESVANNKIYDAETGEFRAPNMAAVTDVVTNMLPMLPSFMVGGGGAQVGMKMLGMGEKASALAGYGGFNMLVGSSDVFESTTEEARTFLDQHEDLNDEERNVLANAIASEATIRQMPVSFITGAIGLGGAATATGSMAKRVLKGLGQEAPSEGVEEGFGKFSGNVAMQRIDKDRNALEGVPDATVMGAVAGAVLGGGLALPGTNTPSQASETTNVAKQVASPIAEASTVEEVISAAQELNSGAGDLGDRASVAPTLSDTSGGGKPLSEIQLREQIPTLVEGKAEPEWMTRPADELILETDMRIESFQNLKGCLRG